MLKRHLALQLSATSFCMRVTNRTCSQAASISHLPACFRHADTRSGIQGIVYALDIAQVMGDKMPVCKETDFEQWTVPADDHTPRCLLGELPGSAWLQPTLACPNTFCYEL
jgi:hypothetical protein